MIYTFGIAITFFLSFILSTKKEKSNADKILAIWLGVVGVHLTLYYLIFSKLYLEFPYLLGLEIPMPLLHGPFIFLYTTALTQQKATDGKRLLHFIPYLIGLLAMVPFLILSSTEKIAVYFHEGDAYETLLIVFFLSIILSGFTYSFLSLRAVIRHHRSILEIYSYTERVSLKWLYFLIFGLSIIWIAVIFADDQYIFAAVVLYVLLIGYYGIKQVGIFTNQSIDIATGQSEPKDTENKPTPSEKVKYEKSELTALQLETIHENLAQVMRAEKLYQTPELTLSDVAIKLSVHPNTLSQVINRMEQKNFFDYINGLRVEEFKKRITQAENQQFKMLSVAYDCGFNSKTSFNRNFKKAVGISPTEYLEKDMARPN